MLDFEGIKDTIYISKQGRKVVRGRGGRGKDRILKGNKDKLINREHNKTSGETSQFISGELGNRYQLIVVTIQSRVACKNKPKLPRLSQN